MFGFPAPPYVSCAECGALFRRLEQGEHVCERERWVDYQVCRMRPGIQRFYTEDLPRWLDSNEGRFERYWAERQRRANG